MKEKIQRQRGITLVALVITIIIIIILSTVTINMVLGDNGLIKQAELARDMAANSVTAEGESMNGLMQEYANVMAEDSELPDPEIPFEPQPTPEPPTGGEKMTDMTNGIIEIKWLRGTSDNVTDTPNAPVIKTDLPSGTTMEQVVFNEESNTWVPGMEYSYVAGTGSNDNTASHWANARVSIDGIESYFVWIPRYAYRIIYFDSSESKIAYQEGILSEEDAVANGQIIGYSDSRGIVDAQGRKIESVASTTKTMVSEDYFMVHPAFMNGTSTGFENGEWNTELEGIWVGKYEVARSDTVGSTQGKATTIKVQPGVTSFREVTIGNMYTYAKAYSKKLNSHMLKNSEWGAVAYLTESKYGRNGNEIKFSDQGYITGGGIGLAYVDSNKLQSSTGNEYGIYDLSGVSSEYVATYYKYGGDNMSNGSSFTNGISDEYSTAYDETSISTGYKYGDAIYETYSWHSNPTKFIATDAPFFDRGGRYSAKGGLFYSGGYFGNGDPGSVYSFRLILVTN